MLQPGAYSRCRRWARSQPRLDRLLQLPMAVRTAWFEDCSGCYSGLSVASAGFASRHLLELLAAELPHVSLGPSAGLQTLGLAPTL